MTFKKQSPESVGLSSKNIHAFICELAKAKIPMHSILVYRNGALVTEGYYAPFTRKTHHRLFSVTKSMVAVAVGELVRLGQIGLSDPISQYFSEYISEDTHPYIKTMTIEHLLKMETCHSSTTYKFDADVHWVKSFFSTPPSHRPGSHFNYDTSASHTLAALVKRLSGKNVLDYLRETFLKDTHFSPDAYIIKDPFGESMGGSGLMARPMDMLIFAQKVMALRADDAYLFSATSNLTDTQLKGATVSEKQGYGYQFWQIENEGYACYGMGGQYALCYPKLDLIIVTTADTQSLKEGNSAIFNGVKTHILDHISEHPLDENPEAYQQLEETTSHLSITTPSERITESFEREYRLEMNTSSFKKVHISLDSRINQGVLTLYKDQEVFTIPFGFDQGILSTFPVYNMQCFSSGYWLRKNRLHIKTHLIDECVGSIDFHLSFHEDEHLSIFMKKIEETGFHEFNGYFESAEA